MNISLSLSGGGFRASAFSHGALLLLHKVEIEDQLHILSSVSGGTITAIMYSLYGNDFNKFNSKLSRVHEDDNLIERAAEVLANDEVSVPSGRKNIITAFAEVYNRDLFSSATFGDLWKIAEDVPIHLREIIFNATEFKTGIAFRFQKTASKKAKIGNGNVFIPLASAQNIRLADILASSSCFTVGFEPLVLPDDFSLDNSVAIDISKSLSNKIHEGRLALMDGGIYDNQGIESVILANDRIKKEEDKTDFDAHC